MNWRRFAIGFLTPIALLLFVGLIVECGPRYPIATGSVILFAACLTVGIAVGTP